MDEGSRVSPTPSCWYGRPRGTGRRSAGGYRIAVEGHRWRPADEQERSRLTRIAVDRGVEPQTVRVISAPLILDGPGRPGAGRPSSRCCAVMVVTRLKDAAAAVSRICGRGSPIPIFAQVRGILTIWAHRCAAAVWSAHRRVFTAVGSRPPDPDRPHGGHSSLTARTRCAQHGRGHSARPGAFLSRRGHSTPSGTAIPSPTRETSPAGRKCPRTRRMSPHASELSETRRTLVVSNTARLPLSRGHRRPRMATDSTTTADTTFVRAALRTIVTIGDS